ncbi:phage antirepressor KilAC domain-containing protein [Streptomyces sp. NBC_00006]|uniref:phage antirepressor KilAC domain-containing protein n=1 Tax=Streptomyces sp. NBC_00006 TaxID=2975619 RepID=UPI00225A0021|nr:phage antirepressor KilAC domain-containing protein [Streptomyces sp. NBC_00006]MCX5529017.1 phage antirepressor KilAC domain-containing protein [Streptomyces sp. NBC_00006]MCX5537751.1 phage antirepressor KilAC domain-containing protein [Streptomyces sp. NBC_00006]
MSSIQPSSGSSPFDGIRQISADGDEYWSARDLQPLLGYDRWERFTDALDRAIAAADNAGTEPMDHFRGAAKMVPIGSGATREVVDFHLTRFAAYLIAMNGDPRKPEIAAAQTYFAVKTREAEVGAPREMTKLEALQAAIESEQARIVAEARVAELEPAAHSWNTLASAEGDFSVADAAKILSRDPSINTGRNRLFGMLHELGWAYVQNADHRYRANQYAIERRWLSELPQSHYHPRTGELVLDAPQLRVTVKGLNELHKRLGGTAQLSLPTLPVQGGAS